MVEFKHVDKVYPNGYKALSDVNLTIHDGEFVSIIGLSGAGKSTLIRCVNRMHDIQGGELLVDGVDISRLRGKALRMERRGIGMIFQSFNLHHINSLPFSKLSPDCGSTAARRFHPAASVPPKEPPPCIAAAAFPSAALCFSACSSRQPAPASSSDAPPASP